MANGTDSEEFVVLSRVRMGLKREFKFALKAQSEICGSLGRTRARSSSNGVSGNAGNINHSYNNQSNKRLKSSGSPEGEKKKGIEKDREVRNLKESMKIDGDGMDIVSEEEEAKSDVVDLEEAKGELVESVSERGCNDEAAMAAAEDESALLELGEPMCEEEQEKKGQEEDGKCEEEREKENNHENAVVEDDKCEEEREKDKEKENDHEKEVVEENKPENEPEKGLVRDKEEKKEGDEDLVKEDSTTVEMSVPCEEGSSRSSGPISDSGKGNRKAENGLVEKPLRRFTRSLLKPKVETVKISAGEGDVEETSVKEVANDNDGIGADAVSSSQFATPTKQETMSEKKVGRNFPTKLKDLLDTGILEGLNVKYIRDLKVRGAGPLGLRGVVKDSGILCFCSACKGTKVVTPATYEVHAGSSNKRPPEYIFLENGNTLRDVMNACKNSPLATLEQTVRMVVGSSLQNSSFCLNCRGSISEAGTGKTAILCNSCMELKEPQKVSQARSTRMTDAIDGSLKLNLVPKPSYSAQKCSSSQSNSRGRITRKDLRLHKLVFEENVLPDGTEVAYFVRGQKLLVGLKQGFGILCSCCETVVSPSQFEAHAGCAKRRKPFQHIYISNGVSLHELSIALSKGRKFSIKDNDDLCSICADGGDLLCCDTCPRAFHIECVSLPTIPRGKWSCKYCENMFMKEKFVEHNANAVAAGRVAGVDAIEQITNRCIRIVNSIGTVTGSVCVLCRGTDFRTSGFGSRTVIICDQCEKEFHVGCLRDHDIDDLKELPKGQWFCCTDCNKIYTAMQKLIIRGEEKLPDSFMNVVKKKQEENGSESSTNVDIRWRVLNGKMYSSADTRVLLSNTVSIFHDQFDPIIESSSREDLIPGMVYGRNLMGQDFDGMYSAILTVNHVIVSVAIFRVLGPELAELPLVATRKECQGKGYFQCLFSCIETLLSFLKVRHLVLPAADEAKSIWTDKFCFEMMTDDELSDYRKDYQMMIFDGTSILRKPVPKCRVVAKPENS